jgi:hypothetical protein
LVSATGHRDDEIPIRAEYFAKRRHVHIDIAFFDDDAWPYCIHQLVSRHQTPTCGYEHRKHVEGARTETNELAIQLQATHSQINVETSQFHD